MIAEYAKRHYLSLDDFRSEILYISDNIPRHVIKALVDSIPESAQAIYYAKGGNTKY